MAVQIDNFCGFETQGVEEASSVTGSPIITVGQRTGGAACRITSGVDYDLPWTADGLSDGSGNRGFGFAIQWDTVTADATEAIYLDDAGAGGAHIKFNIHTDGTLRVTDQAGTGKLFSIDALVAEKKYYVELFFSNSSSGTGTLFIDKVQQDTVVDGDWQINGGSSNVLVHFGHDGTNDYEVDDVYIASSLVGGASDLLGPIEVYMKQGAQTGTTPDIATASTGVLDEGSWDLASETPLNEQSQAAAASYTSTDDDGGMVYADGSGDKSGPNGDDRFLGTTIKAIKGIWRTARSGGGGTAQFGLVGNAGGAGSDREETADLDIGTGYGNFAYLTETAAVLPSLTENAAIGFRKGAGGQDMDVAEMWLMILTVPAAPTITALSDSDLEYPDQNYFVGPFEI